jgi:hypothetical protein
VPSMVIPQAKTHSWLYQNPGGAVLGNHAVPSERKTNMLLILTLLPILRFFVG